MKRSTDAILTTHVGRLQRPDTITEKLVDRYAGKAVDQAALDADLKASVAEVVRQQVEAGRQPSLWPFAVNLPSRMAWCG